MRRREFIGLIGGAAMWPLAARAQEPGRVRRIGVLTGQGANDPQGQSRIAALLQGLQELGWSVGRNARIDVRWSAGNADEVRKYAAELVALAPNVIFSSGTPAAAALLQATRTIPIVITVVADPVGAGFVDSLARPGGNATGFILQTLALSGWTIGRNVRIDTRWGAGDPERIRDPSMLSGPQVLPLVLAPLCSLIRPETSNALGRVTPHAWPSVNALLVGQHCYVLDSAPLRT